ncbi:MAG: hypothetical protein E6R03_03475 [Hyphomicrobiaceae bacterium]|nr:MAG: hypothetical protein E6R03_03475 [Hyphomicrobiaceae bacterium]
MTIIAKSHVVPILWTSIYEVDLKRLAIARLRDKSRQYFVSHPVDPVNPVRNGVSLESWICQSGTERRRRIADRHDRKNRQRTWLSRGNSIRANRRTRQLVAMPEPALNIAYQLSFPIDVKYACNVAGALAPPRGPICKLDKTTGTDFAPLLEIESMCNTYAAQLQYANAFGESN